MLPSSEQCYRAMQSRDARFDGRFFVGVVTTGVYCRPVCRARLPRLENVRFYACAAAAEAAGFRPCRRCRPETAPGTAAWSGTSAAVARALRLIDDGALDGGSTVDQLAERLGLGARHMRRLFQRHLGTSPVAIAHTRRTHFARQLLDETALPMTRIAEIAGFSSIRRFNAAIRDTFGRSPTELRGGQRHKSRRGHSSCGGSSSPTELRGGQRHKGAGLCVRLPHRQPFAWTALIGFLSARAIPGVETVDETAYRRTVRLACSATTMAVFPAADTLMLQIADPAALADAVARARRMFDVAADSLCIAAHLRADARLRPLVDVYPGLRVPGCWDGFELAVRAILGQQVSVRAANTLAGRVVAAYGQRVGHGSLTHLFPTAETLANADLTTIGLPGARAQAICLLARAVANGSIRFDGTMAPEVFFAAMTGIPGVGPWTAQYVAMRALGDPDALPTGDLGLRRALAPGAMVSARELEVHARAWRPWRSYAAMYLWTSAAAAPGAGMTSGTRTPGMEASGTEMSAEISTEISGTKSSGTKSSDTKSSGTKSSEISDTKSSGTEISGTEISKISGAEATR